jgi:hypothetical protein
MICHPGFVAVRDRACVIDHGDLIEQRVKKSRDR